VVVRVEFEELIHPRKLMTRPPGTGVAAPESPVPEPRGVTGTPCRLANLASSLTWRVLLGRTTAKVRRAPRAGFVVQVIG